MIVGQLSDLHCIEPGTDEPDHPDLNGRAALAVERLNAETPAPSIVIGTGDLTQNGTPGDYEALQTVSGPIALPFLPLPGNHDDPARLRSEFPDVPWAGDHSSWSVPFGPVHLIGLDTTRAGEHGGEFDARREEWLRAALETAEAPVLLAMHHPPFATGIEWMDLEFAGVERLVACIGEHRDGACRITKVIFGHIHRPVTAAVAGVPAQSGISTAHHVELDLVPGAGARLVDDPIGYLLHWWDGSGWVSHTRYVGTGTTAFTPEWASET